MSNPEKPRPDSKRLLLGLAQLYFIVSLLVPMLVPAGMMLSRNSESNIVELSICSAFDPRTVLLNIETGELVNPDLHLASTSTASDNSDTKHHPGTDKKLCPFQLATTAHLTISALVASQIAPPTVASDDHLGEIFYSQTVHPSSPPRGPPLVS